MPAAGKAGETSGKDVFGSSTGRYNPKKLFCTSDKGWNGGTISREDGLTRETCPSRDKTSGLESCQLPLESRDVIMFDEFGIDLIELQNRLLELEKQLKNDHLEVPPIFSDLKSQVENFRNKLETAESYKKSDLQKEPFYQRFQYRRTSSERGRRIRDKFLNICEKEINKSTVDWLKQPSFDSSQYEDEEILLFLQHMFLELGLITKFDIPLPILRNFLYEVYKNYNEVPFHNFRHCFCVAQMMYVMIWSVDIPNRMGDLDTLILLTSCICHDLDHPGYNNIYQINARTELALLYNDISPLENHHCSVAFRILENPDCNIFASLDKETFKEIREGIIRCILATDMARHNEILTQFKEVIPEFDFSNKGHKNLLSMILIKVADISNEARPMNVAEPWLDRLLTEFFKQSDAEKEEGLPVTPFMDREKITKPSSQCSFIGFVLLPLFEALGELLPELHDLIIAPAKYALEHYRRLNEAAKDERLRRKSVVDSANSENNEESENVGMVKSGSVRSRRSFCTQMRQRTKSEEIETDATPPLSPGAFSELVEESKFLDEGDDIQEEEEEEEEMDEETVTEVEVSEKTLKFKISTEGSATTGLVGRKSCQGSRKGSRERNQYLDNDAEWCRLMKEEDGREFLKRSVTSDTMISGKGSTDSEKAYGDKAGRRWCNSGGFERDESSHRSLNQKEHKPVMSCCRKSNYEHRRKSLAVVERPRVWDHSKRRSSSISTAAQGRCPSEISSAAKPTREPATGVKKPKKEQKREQIDESILDKLDRDEIKSRYSRDFETSCWGLQNLKRDPTQSVNQNQVISSNSLKMSAVSSEKSKSEDNLAISASEKLGIDNLGNNLNASKTDGSIEKQMTITSGGEMEKKKKSDGSGHPSFLSRLRQLKGRMSFGKDSAEVNNPRDAGPNLREKTGKSTGENRRKEFADDFEKSRTLPKAEGPNHRTSGRMRRGWRALIGKSAEGNSSCSSLNATSFPGSPNPRSRRKSSAEEIKAISSESFGGGGEKKNSSTGSFLPSPKKSIFPGRFGRGQEEENFRKQPNFLNNLTSSLRKRGTGGRNQKSDEENGASSSSSMQDGSKPN